MRDVYVALIYLAMLAMGLAAPFLFSLAYIWVDTFSPQTIAPEMLGLIPASMIVAILAIGSYAVADHRKTAPPLTSWLLLAFAVWITLSTALWAELPGPAWEKWNPAFKTLCFAAFMPLVFRSRVQIEAALQIYVFALAVHYVPGGIKTMLGGGGYGRTIGVVGGNSLLAEGSTLCAVTVMLVPILLFLREHSLLLPKVHLLRNGYFVLVACAVATAIGTYERTGLVGMAVMGAGLWLRARRKLLYGVGGGGVAVVIALTTSDAWTSRISTINDYNNETSALGRILVWRWTMDYVSNHPLGGGFNSFMIDTITFPGQGGQPGLTRNGVAFHSIYFEVLGEQGYFGLGLFLFIALYTLYILQRAAKIARGRHDLRWAADLSRALQVSLVSFMICGAFIGVAFQPMIYFLFAVAACVGSHVRAAAGVGRIASEEASSPDLWAAARGDAPATAVES